MIQDFKPGLLVEAAHKAAKAAEEAAVARAKADMLSEQKKNVLASIKNNIERESDGKSITEAKLERLARGTEQWTAFCEGLFAAIENAVRLEAVAKGADLEFRAIQSDQSYNKELIRGNVS